MENELRSLARSAIEEVLEALKARYPVEALIEIIDNALGIRVCSSYVGDGWELDEVQLMLASGGPNVWAIIRDGEIVGRACWGSRCVEEKAETELASDALDYISDILSHRA